MANKKKVRSVPQQIKALQREINRIKGAAWELRNDIENIVEELHDTDREPYNDAIHEAIDSLEGVTNDIDNVCSGTDITLF